MKNDNAIVVNGLIKSFNNLEVLKGLDIQIERGTMLALLGPNGSGKTTTIRILSTLMRADGGMATVNGYDVVKDAHKVRQSIGLTGQYAAVDEFLSGRENLEMMGKLYHLRMSDVKQRISELLKQFDLESAADKPVRTYSGGMRRKLDLAASLIATPPIIFLDEPTTGLDPRSRLAMWDIIAKLVEADVTILLTTQYLEEADRLADKIAVLNDGKIIVTGTADELKSKVGRERIEVFIKKESNFDQAVKAVNDPSMRMDKQERSISVATGGSVKELKKLLDKMDKSGIEIESLSVHKPTLDDVFINFTGHKATAEELNNSNH